MIRDYTGTFNVPSLTEEIAAEFPALNDDHSLMFEAIEGGLRLHIPGDATPQLLVRLDSIVSQHDPSSFSSNQALRQQIINTAQSAVDVTLDNLTTSQVKALLCCLLYRAGAVDPSTMTIKALSKWL